MTRAREWPNNAKEARDRAAEEAAHGARVLMPVLENPDMTEGEKIRRVGIAVKCFQLILRLLESVGAQTRP